MKQIIAGLLLASLPQWLPNALADVPKEDAVAIEAHVVQFTAGDGSTRAIQITGDGDGSGVAWATVSADVDTDAGDGRSEGETTRRVVVKLSHDSDGEAEDRGWLGVTIGIISGDGPAVRVLNVAEGGPADNVGILARDIVVSIDGGDQITDTGSLIRAISGKSPGEVITIELIRDGQPHTVDVELGSRADMPQMNWKMRLGAHFGRLDEDVRIRGKILRRGDNNEWVFEDLGNFGELALLPEHIKMFLPRQSDRSTRVEIEDGKRTIETRLERDGQVLIVERVDDGEVSEITVRRIDEDGIETTETYADKDELRESDEEAFDAIDRANVFEFYLDLGNMEELTDLDIDMPHFVFDLDSHSLTGRANEWHERLAEQFGSGMEMHKEALANLEEVLATLGADGGHAVLMERFHDAKPRYSFKELDDGQIEVRTRKGDSEIVRMYADENDLAERSPKLFLRYESLLDGEE